MCRTGARAFALKLLVTVFAIIALDQTFRGHILSSPGMYQYTDIQSYIDTFGNFLTCSFDFFQTKSWRST